ncbi:MAG: zinc metallopeptidase [Armatimonadota bacterium]
MFGFHDATYLLIIPAILLSLYAQWKVQSTFRKYAQVPTHRRLTGAETADSILHGHGVTAGIDPASSIAFSELASVRVEPVPGELSDHYDPRQRVLRLSDPVYSSSSIAAVSVAAHEAGHALQHATRYPYLGLRSLAVPVANIGSQLTFPIILVGMFSGMFVQALNIAIVLYLGVVAFTVITLPVEINASRRALQVLEQGGYLTADELPGARAVLGAAALTYIAATMAAVLMLLRLIILRDMSRR